MAMVCGMQAERDSNLIRDTMLWTKNQVMVCILGIMGGFTRETSKMTSEMDSVNYTKMIIL